MAVATVEPSEHLVHPRTTHAKDACEVGLVLCGAVVEKGLVVAGKCERIAFGFGLWSGAENVVNSGPGVERDGLDSTESLELQGPEFDEGLIRRVFGSGSFLRPVRVSGTNQLTENAERAASRRFAFIAFPARTSDQPAASPNLSVSRESRRGPGGTAQVPLGPRNSPAKTLRVSGYHPPKSYQPVSSRHPDASNRNATAKAY
jgi:hypothetical protein